METRRMANKVRLGIIGLGARGSRYAGFIQDGMVPNMEIGAICDVDPRSRRQTGVLENFAANVLYGTPLIAPGSDGINGVRLANAIHLSSWTGKEAALS
jgi:predicted dehydrogenase